MTNGRKNFRGGVRLAMAGLGAASMFVAASAHGTEPPAESPDALRGPSVGDTPREKSLVERDFSGKLKRLDVDPAIAALGHIELTKEERANVDRVINERNTLMDELVLDNLKDIVALSGARQAGDRAAVRESFVRVYEKFRPVVRRGSLVQELKGALPEAKYAELQRLTSEYAKASVDDREMEMRADGEDGAAEMAAPNRPGRRDGRGGYGAAGGARAQELMGNFGQEIKRSYERVLGSRAKDFDELLASLSLRPEQESKIRGLVTDLVQKSLGKPSARETSRVFMQVYRELDAEQRAALMQKFRERRGEPMKDEAGKTGSKG